jgi:hypothetical protein
MQWILGYATKGAELAWLSVSPESLLVPATLKRAFAAGPPSLCNIGVNSDEVACRGVSF